MHFGHNNPKFVYFMRDSVSNQQFVLSTSDSERDLGNTITSDAKWSTHANTCAAKANKILGWMKSSFMCRDEHLWKQLYTTYIRPLLEFAAPAWNVYQDQDIKCLERIQRRATKVSQNLKHLSYERRLATLGLSTREERRVRGACIQLFKILTSRD
jgi:ribonuclease P/MRP protein subunit RPP40